MAIVTRAVNVLPLVLASGLAACTTFGPGEVTPPERDAAPRDPVVVVPPVPPATDGGVREGGVRDAGASDVRELVCARYPNALACADYRAGADTRTFFGIGGTATPGELDTFGTSAPFVADGILRVEVGDAAARWMVRLPASPAASFKVRARIVAVDANVPVAIMRFDTRGGPCTLLAGRASCTLVCGTQANGTTIPARATPFEVELTESAFRVDDAMSATTNLAGTSAVRIGLGGGTGNAVVGVSFDYVVLE